MADSITLKSVQNSGTVTLVANNQTILLQGKAQGPQGIQGPQGDPATNLVTSVAGKQGIVTLTKSDVGLSNAENTSDLSKPISTATQTALDTKATTTAPDAHANNTSNPHAVTKAQVGLGNAENTSDADKPVSTAQQTALDGKANFPTTNQRMPVRSSSGAQSSERYDQAVAAFSIPQRTNTGTVKAATAVANDDLVPKAQMDAADALKVNKAGDTMTGALNTQDVRGSAASTYNLGQTSNRYFNVFVDRVRLGSTELTMLSGTGFPEGVVTASVGSIYIDTAVTSGASSWIKKSGTGNTGWKVLEGDTGWRNISSLINTTAFNVSNTPTSYIRIRRVGNTVHVLGRVDTVVSTTTTSYQMFTGLTPLSGFRVYSNYPPIVGITASNGWSPATNIIGRSAIGTDSYEFAQFSSGVNVSINQTYTTNEDWPSTLPGTAV